MMTAGRATLSVVMFVKNEARRIGPALDSIRWVDEIVIIDDASTDETAAMCRAAGARVITCDDSKGLFYKRRNFGFNAAAGDWVLMMDPDERMTPELRAAIERMLRDPGPYLGFNFWRRNFFWGRALAHGGWRHRSMHLFKRGAGVDRGQELHSPIEVDGPIGDLDAPMDHYPFGSIAEIVAKQNFYTSLEAPELAARWSQPTDALGRQMATRPLKTFWKLYVKKRGFLDGLPGLVLAALYAWVELLRWAKCWECLLKRDAAAAASSATAPSTPASAPASSESTRETVSA